MEVGVLIELFGGCIQDVTIFKDVEKGEKIYYEKMKEIADVFNKEEFDAITNEIGNNTDKDFYQYFIAKVK